ncbi:MAG: helix-turn-helix domain-containing protein [Candidatus Cryptobacteroides sp.]
MNIRISQFLNAENITQAQFADTIGVARASISHIIAGRNKPSYDFIASVLKNYPRINPSWLILGKGRMYIDSESQIDVQSPVLPQKMDSQTDLLFPIETPSQNNSIFIDGSTLKTDETPESPAAQPEVRTAQSPADDSTPKRISRIIVLFDDGSFQELRNQ